MKLAARPRDLLVLAAVMLCVVALPPCADAMDANNFDKPFPKPFWKEIMSISRAGGAAQVDALFDTGPGAVPVPIPRTFGPAPLLCAGAPAAGMFVEVFQRGLPPGPADVAFDLSSSKKGFRLGILILVSGCRRADFRNMLEAHLFKIQNNGILNYDCTPKDGVPQIDKRKLAGPIAEINATTFAIWDAPGLSDISTGDDFGHVVLRQDATLDFSATFKFFIHCNCDPTKPRTSELVGVVNWDAHIQVTVGTPSKGGGQAPTVPTNPAPTAADNTEYNDTKAVFGYDSTEYTFTAR